MTTPAQHAVYNVADDEPSAPDDVALYAADLLGLQPPPAVPYSDAKLTPMAASFYAECKRVRNERMKTALGVRLEFPSYREGLLAIVTAS